LYVVQDANYNVTALFDNPGNVVERYVYDPFGQVTVLDAGWNVLAASAFAWVYLHQGGRFDATSGLYHFRHRDYSPTLGRWVNLDPIRYEAGDVNLYRALGNSVTNRLDPSGLDDWYWPWEKEADWSDWRIGTALRKTIRSVCDEFGMVADYIRSDPAGAAWEATKGVSHGANQLFVQLVVRTGQAVGDIGGLVLINGYQPVNPHLAGYVSGDRTWYGTTFDLVLDGLAVIPVAQGGRSLMRVGKGAWGRVYAHPYDSVASANSSRARIFSSTTEIGSGLLPAGTGYTDKFGNVVYSTLGSAQDVALVRYHESIHSFLSPRLNLLREARADLGMAAYNRSSLVRYLEEALAESYAQLRVNGIRGLPTGLTFPVREGYVTWRAVAVEGGVYVIIVGGSSYVAYKLSEQLNK
jgi:RHS repeat-associated protein